MRNLFESIKRKYVIIFLLLIHLHSHLIFGILIIDILIEHIDLFMSVWADSQISKHFVIFNAKKLLTVRQC